MSPWQAVAGALLACAIGACGHTHVYDAVLRPEAHAPGARGPVELYLGAQRPTRPFYDVGLVQAVGFGDDATPEDMTRALRTRARELGCDAVVNVSVEQGASLAHGYGVCVRYVTLASPPVAAPPPPATPPAPATPGPATPAPATPAPLPL